MLLGTQHINNNDFININCENIYKSLTLIKKYSKTYTIQMKKYHKEYRQLRLLLKFDIQSATAPEENDVIRTH